MFSVCVNTSVIVYLFIYFGLFNFLVFDFLRFYITVYYYNTILWLTLGNIAELTLTLIYRSLHSLQYNCEQHNLKCYIRSAA